MGGGGDRVVKGDTQVDVDRACSTLTAFIRADMAASRYDASQVFPEFRVDTPQGRFSVPTGAVRIRRNGVEFRGPSPLPVWSEMTVVLQVPALGQPLCCRGVVVACDGTRHEGYVISLLFLDLPHGSEQQLRSVSGAALF